MLNLVYSSTAVRPFSEDDLTGLLHQARAKNVRLGITGLLLYKNGTFMQALEGEESKVRALYATIRADPRHHHIVTLVDLPIAQPRFADWSMGFENLDDIALESLTGNKPRVQLPPTVEFPWRGSVAMQFLASFWGVAASGA